MLQSLLQDVSLPPVQKLCLNCKIQGVVKIQHHTGKVVSTTQKLTVTFVAETQSGKPSLGPSNLVSRWVTVPEARALSSFVLDSDVKVLLQSVYSGAAIYPASIVECIDTQGVRKRLKKLPVFCFQYCMYVYIIKIIQELILHVQCIYCILSSLYWMQC